VWSSTWVPSASPIVGYGADGYAACWVDLDDGARAQVLVDGEPPTPGTGGRIEERWYGDERVDLFCRAEA
jgi:hypothetical protein